MVENTMGKGEIARYERFLLFPQRFQKTCAADTYKQVLVRERIEVSFGTDLIQYKTTSIPLFHYLIDQSVESAVVAFVKEVDVRN